MAFATGKKLQMDRALKILLVEDSEIDAELQFRELKRAGLSFEARQVQTESDFVRIPLQFKQRVAMIN